MRSCVKIFKVNIFLILNPSCTTCFDRYGLHQVLKILLLKTATITSINAIPNYTRIYAPICCCASVTCSSNCVSVSRMKYIGVACSVAGYLVICSA
jgi:hypothetical protein